MREPRGTPVSKTESGIEGARGTAAVWGNPRKWSSAAGGGIERQRGESPLGDDCRGVYQFGAIGGETYTGDGGGGEGEAEGGVEGGADAELAREDGIRFAAAVVTAAAAATAAVTAAGTEDWERRGREGGGF